MSYLLTLPQHTLSVLRLFYDECSTIVDNAWQLCNCSNCFLHRSMLYSMYTERRKNIVFITIINQTIANIAHAITAYNVERRTTKELNKLTDRDLMDIGITRYDIPAIAKYDASKKPATKSKLYGLCAENA